MVGGALGFDMPAFDAPYEEPRILGEMCLMNGLTVVRVAQMMERLASAKLELSEEMLDSKRKLTSKEEQDHHPRIGQRYPWTESTQSVS